MMPQGLWSPVRRNEFYEEHMVPWHEPIKVPSVAGVLLICGISALIMGFAGFVLTSAASSFFFFLWVTNWVITGILGFRFGAIRAGFGGIILYGIFCTFLAIGILFAFAFSGMLGHASTGTIGGIALGAFIGPLIYGMVSRAWAIAVLEKAMMVPMMPYPPTDSRMMPMSPAAVRTPYPMTPEAQQFWTGQQPGRGMPPPPPYPPQQ